MAETGAGQHGVASHGGCAVGHGVQGLHGRVDVDRQALNVFRMRLLGSEVESVESGSRTLKDAVNEAMRDWVATVGNTHYCLGSVMGPHPYPWMVREFHRVLGDEARAQCDERLGGPPDVVACVGGRSSAMGIFSGFVDTAAALVGVEPAGGAAIGRCPGVVHGMKSYLLQDEDGQVLEARVDLGRARLSGRRPRAQLPGQHRPGPLRSRHRRRGRRRLPAPVADRGDHPGLEPARHRVGLAPRGLQGRTVLVHLSGRGDKDVAQMMDLLAP